MGKNLAESNKMCGLLVAEWLVREYWTHCGSDLQRWSAGLPSTRGLVLVQIENRSRGHSFWHQSMRVREIERHLAVPCTVRLRYYARNSSAAEGMHHPRTTELSGYRNGTACSQCHCRLPQPTRVRVRNDSEELSIVHLQNKIRETKSIMQKLTIHIWLLVTSCGGKI